MPRRYSIRRMKGPLKALLLRTAPEVRYIQDAKETLAMRLATSDLKRATPVSFTNCPGARCVNRNLPGTKAVISRTVALLIKGDTATRYMLYGGQTRRTIEDADFEGLGIVGRRFRLTAPDHAHKLGPKHRPPTKRQMDKRGTPKEPKTFELPPGTVVSFRKNLRTIEPARRHAKAS
jgi:hypothetical protein